MPLDRFGAVVKAALVAGVCAGLLVAAVQFVWTEPIVDQAIALEEQRRAAERLHMKAPSAQESSAVVEREGQKKGLFLGFGLYGIAWGLLFGAAYFISQPRLPGAGRVGRGIFLALCAYWAVALMPFLKYPGNPPGVGDESTIDYRQRLYLAILVFDILVIGAAFALRRWLASRTGPRPALLLALGFVALCSGVLYFGLPDNPDPSQMPMDLVTSFRVHSLAGLTLFWLALGVCFGFALRLMSKTGRAPGAAPSA